MHNKKRHIRATIKNIIVAFVYVLIILAIIYIPFNSSISRAISLVDMISSSSNKEVSTVDFEINKNSEVPQINIDEKTKDLTDYPEYGAQYGTIKIPSINVDLPLYFGDSLSILKYGIGHSNFSYFPGEGGTVLCMGHNTVKMLKSLPKANIGDNIILDTTYGTYTYQIYDSAIAYQDELEKAPIQREKEILILYTCYPVDGIGHATHRYLVYANLVSEVRK